MSLPIRRTQSRNLDAGTTCPHCGARLVPDGRFCPSCGTQIRALHHSAGPHATTWVAPTPQRRPLLPLSRMDARGAAARPQGEQRHGGLLRTARVVGTIIAADPVIHERHRPRPLQSLGRALASLVLLALPILMALWLLSSGHVIALIAIGAVLFILSRFLSPGGLLGLVGLARLLRSPHGMGGTPVRHFRLRTRDQSELALCATGELRGGHLMPGDEVEARGRWHRGVLELRSVLNVRTGARTRFRATEARGTLVTHLAILAFAALLASVLPSLLGGGR